jgi:hypothetical protein
MRVHEFLIDEDEPERPLETMAELREHVDGLPDTAAFWSPDDATDGWPHRVSDEMLEMLGAWPAPEEYTGSGSIRYVNPGYVHAKEYSDLGFSCGCGEVTYGYGTGSQMETGAIKAHREDCPEVSQKRAKLQLYFARVSWLKRAALFWIRQPVARKRLGFTADHSATRLVKPLGEGYHDWYGRGKDLTANTMTILRGWDVDAQLIADAYGTSRQTVYTYKAHAEPEVVEPRAPQAFEDHRRVA